MCLLWDWISETRLAAKGRGREGGEREEEKKGERNRGRGMLLFGLFPVDVALCKLCAHMHTHFTKIKVFISLGGLLLHIYHYHILIDHKDDISCLQLEKSSEVFFLFFFTTLCLLPSFQHVFPSEKCCFVYFYRALVCVRKTIKVPEVGRESEGSCCTTNRPFLPPVSPLMGWTP